MMESRDAFFIVLSFCAVWFTVFLCWILYQIVRLLRSMNDAMKEIRTPIEKVIQFVKSKTGL